MGGDVIGEINFFSHTTDGAPLWMDVTPKLGTTNSNYARTPARITIHDLRDKENIVDLDMNGFELFKYNGVVHDEFDDNSEMQQRYYDDIAHVLKKRLNANRVIVFSHITRYRGPLLPAEQCNTTHKNPLLYPHVDHDPPSVYLTMKRVLGEEEAEKVMKKRLQIINVWRPLGPNPIIDTPLTICDYSSLDINNDVHASEIRGTPFTSSLYMISRNSQDKQKWYYLSEMSSNEMFVFKIFDSKPDVAQYGAHTAFINESIQPTGVKQCSIEVRCLVLYDE